MKKIILTMAMFALMAMTATTAMAQEEDQDINTIFGGKKFSSSGYGGPSIKFSQVDNEFAMFVGGKGAWTINKQFSIGGAGYGLVTWPEFTYQNGQNETIDADFMFGYGGLYLEYIHDPWEVLHFSANTLIGFGGASVQDIDRMNMDDYDHDEIWAAYFVLEPSIAVELNVAKFFRIQVEAGYRFVDEIRSNSEFKSIDKAKDMELSGVSGGITFQFGSF